MSGALINSALSLRNAAADKLLARALDELRGELACYVEGASICQDNDAGEFVPDPASLDSDELSNMVDLASLITEIEAHLCFAPAGPQWLDQAIAMVLANRESAS